MTKQLTPRTVDLSDDGDNFPSHWLTAVTRYKGSPDSHLIIFMTGPAGIGKPLIDWLGKVGEKPNEIIDFATMLDRLRAEKPKPAGFGGDAIRALGVNRKVSTAHDGLVAAATMLVTQQLQLASLGQSFDQTAALVKLASCLDMALAPHFRNRTLSCWSALIESL